MIDDTTRIRHRASDSGMVFQLDGAAARIRAMLEAPHTLGASCEAPVARHDASPEQCRAKVTAFIAAIVTDG